MRTTQHRLYVAAILLLVLIPPLWAQDRDPQISTLTTTQSGARGVSERARLSKQFMLGFNWGEVPRDSNDIKALRIKVVHEGLWQGSTEADLTLNSFLPWGTGLIHADQEVSHGGAALPYVWSEAFEFDPTISNIGSVYSFTPRVGDTTGAAWGFKMRDTTVMDTVAGTSNDGYRRVLLTVDKLQGSNQQKGLSLSTPRLILANPWPDVLQVNNNWAEIYKTYQSWVHHRDGLNNFMPGSNEMFVRDYRIPNNYFAAQVKMYKRDGNDNIVYDSTTGQPIIETHAAGSWLDTVMRPGSITIIHMKGDSTEWWLSANIRRLENLAQVNTPSNAIVMSFKVPFTRRYDTLYYRGPELQSTQKGTVVDTVYARFDSTAVAGNTVTHSHYGRMDNTLAAYDSTVFYIRAGMLPPYDAEIDGVIRPDITLSAHFWLPKFEVNDRYKAYEPGRVKLEAPPFYWKSVVHQRAAPTIQGSTTSRRATANGGYRGQECNTFMLHRSSAGAWVAPSIKTPMLAGSVVMTAHWVCAMDTEGCAISKMGLKKHLRLIWRPKSTMATRMPRGRTYRLQTYRIVSTLY